jgi:hypothetical protein
MVMLLLEPLVIERQPEDKIRVSRAVYPRTRAEENTTMPRGKRYGPGADRGASTWTCQPWQIWYP